jgi:hypothetical protein
VSIDAGMPPANRADNDRRVHLLLREPSRTADLQAGTVAAHLHAQLSDARHKNINLEDAPPQARPGPNLASLDRVRFGHPTATVAEHLMRNFAIGSHLCEPHLPGDTLRTVASSSTTKSDNHP